MRNRKGIAGIFRVIAGGYLIYLGVKLIRDGLWHTVTVDLGALPFWKGTVNRIRFDYFDSCSVGDAIYVRAIRLK